MTGDELRAYALSLPEAHEELTWEVHPTFRVRGKIFAIASADERSVRLKATPEAQQALVTSDPDTFFLPSHVARFGWVGVQLDRADSGEVCELVEDAWRRTAPRRVVKMFDERGGRT